MPVGTWRRQEEGLPQDGAVLLATFDDQTVVVYQGFRRSIAEEAVAEQRFGAAFRLTRMSWNKPGFLWMMYRSAWASKEDQQRILAVRVRRDAFYRWLAGRVPSSFDRTSFPSSDAWKAAVQRSSVRIQWDPAPSDAVSITQRDSWRNTMSSRWSSLIPADDGSGAVDGVGGDCDGIGDTERNVAVIVGIQADHLSHTSLRGPDSKCRRRAGRLRRRHLPKLRPRGQRTPAGGLSGWLRRLESAPTLF